MHKLLQLLLTCTLRRKLKNTGNNIKSQQDLGTPLAWKGTQRQSGAMLRTDLAQFLPISVIKGIARPRAKGMEIEVAKSHCKDTLSMPSILNEINLRHAV